MSRLIALGALLVPLAGLTACTEQAEATWKDGLEQELRRVDEASPGKLGVYIKHLGEDAELRYDAERFWYLGSAVKVPMCSSKIAASSSGRPGQGAPQSKPAGSTVTEAPSTPPRCAREAGSGRSCPSMRKR